MNYTLNAGAQPRALPQGVEPYARSRESLAEQLPGWARWQGLAERWRDVVLETYRVVGQRQGIALIKTAPAAGQGRHHGYQGGLWEHMGETAQVAVALCELEGNKGHVNPDMVIAGALLHDIGKAWTYGFSPGAKRSRLGRHVSHVGLGVWLVKQALESLGQPLTTEEREGLFHIIDVHHGVPRAPRTLEGVIVHVADSGSAATAAMRIGGVGSPRARSTGAQVAIHLGAARLLARVGREWRRINETFFSGNE